MAEFSGKVVSATFVDPEYSIIKVRYEDNDGNLTVYNLAANPDSQDYKDLLAEGWDTEKIIEETAEEKRAQSAAFNREINYAARLLIEEKFGYTEDESEETSEVNQKFSWDHFFDTMNFNKDEIFKFKIWAFESKKMEGASAEVKRDLRKAATLLEAIKIYEAIP